MTELDFTRYWNGESKEKAREILEDVLKDFPDLNVERIQVGVTTNARGRFHRQKSHSHELYIQLNPQHLSRFTTAHEINHFMTREKVMDLKTIAMGEKYLDQKAGYLSRGEFPNENPAFNQMFKNHKREMVQIARDALEQNQVEPVAYFEDMIEQYVGEHYE